MGCNAYVLEIEMFNTLVDIMLKDLILEYSVSDQYKFNTGALYFNIELLKRLFKSKVWEFPGNENILNSM